MQAPFANSPTSEQAEPRVRLPLVLICDQEEYDISTCDELEAVLELTYDVPRRHCGHVAGQIYRLHLSYKTRDDAQDPRKSRVPAGANCHYVERHLASLCSNEI